MLSQIEKLSQGSVTLRKCIASVRNADTLIDMINCGFRLGMALAAIIVEEILNERGRAQEEAPFCPICGQRLRSKGLAPRLMTTFIGAIRWERRIYRCRKGCRIGTVAPLDRRLGVRPYQRSCDKLKKTACLLAVFAPFELASWFVRELININVSGSSIWNWVQYAGEKAKVRLEKDLIKLKNGSLKKEEIDARTASLPMAVGADGVKAPFRPNKGTPRGKVVWREVKVGIVARIGNRLTRDGKKVSVLVRRKLEASLGDIDEFKPRMWMAAKKEGAEEASDVVWISDGGRGFWRLFNESFSHVAQGILDFYHAAQNIWKGAWALYGPSEKAAMRWFDWIRGLLRQGKAKEVLEQIRISRAFMRGLSGPEKKTVENLIGYLEDHLDHIDYARFKRHGWPIGSGMVESACKWLIQQRFKCVGMSWSAEGFENLLHLRLAWVNGNFTELFEPMPSPNF